MNPATTAAPPKVGFVSLGCPKALTDSELILTQLSAEGYATSKSFAGADLVIVNTCGFIDEAVQGKSGHDRRGAGRERARHRHRLPGGEGCRRRQRRQPGAPDAPAACWPSPARMRRRRSWTRCTCTCPSRTIPSSTWCLPPFDKIGIKLTPRHYAYLKISEGCNHRCTFCIIPSMRGDLVSRPIGDVLNEAERLFEAGREGVAGGQPGHQRLRRRRQVPHRFLGRPAGEDAHVRAVREAGPSSPTRFGAWVRLHYVYPYPHVDEVLPLMATGRVLPYLDVPFQHSHPDVLRRMKRPASGEKNLERLARWRELCPEMVVRSTFIAGFPGETEAEFEHLLAFVREARHRPRRLLRLFAGQGRGGQRTARHAAGRSARGAPRALHGRGRSASRRQAAAPHRRDHAGADRHRAGARPQGRRRAQLCRRAGDRRHGAPAAAREGVARP